MGKIRGSAAFAAAMEFFSKKENRVTAFLIMAAVMALFILQSVKGLHDGQNYLVSDDGSVIGVVRDSEDEEALFPLTLRASKDGMMTERDILLDLKGKTQPVSEPAAVKDTGQDLFEREVDSMVYGLSDGAGTKLMLPLTGEEGIRYEWSREKSRSGYAFLLMMPLFMILLIENNRKKIISDKYIKIV